MTPAAKSPYAGYRFPGEVISHVVWLYFRFPLSLRMVEEMLAARGIDLVGPARPDQSWQSRAEEAFSAADFAVDWDRRVARCPEGKESTGWFESAKRPGQRSSIRARFRAADCRACASRTRCTRARLGLHGRVLALLPKREYEALAAARAREGTAEGRRLYAQRQGVESTLSQGVRALYQVPEGVTRLGL